ncbi:DNA-3-methyladenine glycosylase [Serinicoccus kebangsaanensis]|uniref:DNA-3-methyladenine glycosylase n=1 Tax=Serinicoccus kebangsaanensis TaxID=2602069 RepID=UPI00124D2656|nr:DNA-3-methyladenine glycosylase [Serinicoccus kebangsaanensis]
MTVSGEPGRRWTRDALALPVLQVAPGLLGSLLTHDGVTVRLTEVEAYAGQEDPGSHAFRGPTPRTEVMFGAAGHLYVYLSYGVHRCVNVVTGEPGSASAVLLRAGEVVDGARVARARRLAVRSGVVPGRDLARGPGNLARALGLGADHDGVDLLEVGGPVDLRHGPAPAPGEVRRGPRVGVSGPGGSAERFPWRFWLRSEPSVSAYRAARLPSRATSRH